MTYDRESRLKEKIEEIKKAVEEVRKRTEELELKRIQEQWNKEVEDLRKKPLFFYRPGSSDSELSTVELSRKREEALLEKITDAIIQSGPGRRY